jgi:glycosyltransferase involved in cell wall biosynthesis
MPKTALVIPCFNEAARLPIPEVTRLVEAGLSLVLVDDGSTDGTGALLESFACAHRESVTVVRLERNQGKAEAVRAGLLRALELGAPVVGYADADMSTPASELVRLSEESARCGCAVVMGSRIRLLGTDIGRRFSRHVLGRVFATAASLALDLKVYDTQCGAKFFLPTETLRGALAQPFECTWAFDVELLSRLLAPRAGDPYRPEDFVEVPLRAWSDVAGSKLRPLAALEAGLDLLRIGASARLARAARAARR